MRERDVINHSYQIKNEDQRKERNHGDHGVGPWIFELLSELGEQNDVEEKRG